MWYKWGWEEKGEEKGYSDWKTRPYVGDIPDHLHVRTKGNVKDN